MEEDWAAEDDGDAEDEEGNGRREEGLEEVGEGRHLAWLALALRGRLRLLRWSGGGGGVML